MKTNSRTERLQADYEALAQLRQGSTILDVQAEGDPPDKYVLSFRGRGPCRAGSARGGVEIVSLHKCEVRLPFGYPEQAPDARWLTPLVHPNVSFSGYLSWREIGLVWQPEITLDVVCERLWDLARMAYVNQEEVLNHTAQRWLTEKNEQPLPLDPRALRDILPPANPNIVRYARRDGKRLTLPEPEFPTEIFFIGEDTPLPITPGARRDDDILYIGDE